MVSKECPFLGCVTKATCVAQYSRSCRCVKDTESLAFSKRLTSSGEFFVQIQIFSEYLLIDCYAFKIRFFILKYLWAYNKKNRARILITRKQQISFWLLTLMYLSVLFVGKKIFIGTLFFQGIGRKLSSVCLNVSLSVSLSLLTWVGSKRWSSRNTWQE